MAVEKQRIPIDVHLNGDLTEVTRTLSAQGVAVSQPVSVSGPLAVLMQLLTPANVPVGAVVRPVVVGSSVVGFHVETSDAVAELRQAVFLRNQRQPPRSRRRTP